MATYMSQPPFFIHVHVVDKSRFNPNVNIGYKIGFLEEFVCFILKDVTFDNIFEKCNVLEANRLEPRSGSSYVGHDVGYSLFAISQ